MEINNYNNHYDLFSIYFIIYNIRHIIIWKEPKISNGNIPTYYINEIT